jgi:ATP-dependent RNA helicase SUPV3L1/SUV3
MAMRAQLWALSRNIPTPDLPAPGLVSLAADGVTALSWLPGFAETIGWVPAGPLLLRLDVAERISGELSYLTRRAPSPLPPEILGRFAIKGETVPLVLAGLGFRVIEAEVLGEDVQGPTRPMMVAWQRPAQPERNNRGPRRDQAPRGEGAAAERGPRREGEARPPRNRDRGPRRDAAPVAPAEGAPAEASTEASPVASAEAPRPERELRRDDRNNNRNAKPRAPGGAFGKTGGPGGGGGGGGREDRGPRRDDRDRGPRRDDRGPGGPETRVYHQDSVKVADEDNPFAKLAALKLK